MLRRRIGLISAYPESIYAQRVMSGVFTQCDRYDMEVAVFAPMVKASHFFDDYLRGELNIYQLINYAALDGVIVDSLSIGDGGADWIRGRVLRQVQEQRGIPVVALGVPFGKYPLLTSNDATVFHEVAAHIVGKHHCSDIIFLSGFQGDPVAEARLRGFRAGLEKYGQRLWAEQVVYGNYEYSSGVTLANELISGMRKKPEAVVCCNDKMAIGLVNRLQEAGIRVPEDIIVTGFDASMEAAINEVSISSFLPETEKVAMEAVNEIWRQISPGAAVAEAKLQKQSHFYPAMSCGCEPDALHSANLYREALYFTREYDSGGAAGNYVNIGSLMEGYLFEQLSAAATPQECLQEIYKNVKYLQPFEKFYLCLNPNWDDPADVVKKGYPDQMQMVLYASGNDKSGFVHFKDGEDCFFHTQEMLPQMLDGSEKPMVYYFSPVHFGEKMLGYAVLCRALMQERKADLVYRNFLRHVNIALEMIRAKTKLKLLSVQDEMTGAYNRRGMNIRLEEMLKYAGADEQLIVFVVDMDRLKYINDTFGHTDGDMAIRLISTTAMAATKEGEICVRAGGDEFYIFGVGSYTEKDAAARKQDINSRLKQSGSLLGKPYEITASIGYAIAPAKGVNVDAVLHVADEAMYAEKVAKKVQRT